MNFKRIGRILVCLLLVCALVVNISPIKAEAMALPEIGAAATASKIISLTAPLGVQVFGFVLLGLGLVLTTAGVIRLANEFQAYSDTLDVSIYYYADGSWSYGVDMSFVERVRAWLFEAGYFVTTGTEVGSTSIVFCDGALFEVEQGTFTHSVVSYYDYSYGRTRTGELCWWPWQQADCKNYRYRVNGGSYVGGQIVYANKTEYRYFFYENTSGSLTAPSYGSYSSSTGYSAEQNFVLSFIGAFVSGEIKTLLEDAQLGTVAPQEVPLPEGYSDWYSNSRPAVLPDDEEIQVLPIPLNPDSESEAIPDGVTQSDAWAGSIADPLPDMDTDSEIKTDYTTWFQNVVEGITELPQKIANAFKSLLQELFVPDLEFIPNKVEALKAEYTFLDPMLSTGEDLKLFFQNIGSQPPIIWIDLGAGTGWHPMGGKVKFIDLTWYAQYKPTVDPIVGGFIWLWLAWRMFKAVPDLLAGGSGSVGAPTIAPDLTFNPARLPAGRSRRKKDGE